MLIKEKLVDIVRKEGFDFFSACHIVTNMLKKLKPGKNIYTIGKAKITLIKQRKEGGKRK